MRKGTRKLRGGVRKTRIRHGGFNLNILQNLFWGNPNEHSLRIGPDGSLVRKRDYKFPPRFPVSW